MRELTVVVELFSVVVYVLGGSAAASVTTAATTDTNKTAVVNSTVMFGCRTVIKGVYSFRWQFVSNSHDEAKTGRTTTTVLYNSNGLNPHLKEQFNVIVDQTNGVTVLHIYHVQHNHSGQYRCSAMNGSETTPWIDFSLTVQETTSSGALENPPDSVDHKDDDRPNSKNEAARYNTKNHVIMYSVAAVCLVITIAFAVSTICYINRFSGRMCKTTQQQDAVAVTQAPIDDSKTTPTSAIIDDEQMLYDDALNVLSDCNVSHNVVNGCFLYAEVPTKHRQANQNGQDDDDQTNQETGYAETAFTDPMMTSEVDRQVTSTAEANEYIVSPTYADIGIASGIMSMRC